ncbi:lysostaphin resistance A-like protein [Bacteroidota bacterium]
MIEKIRSNKLLSVLTAIFLGLLVFLLVNLLDDIISNWIGKYTELNYYTGNTVTKFLTLLFSIVLILIFNNGSLKNYGFSKPKKIKYIKSFFISVGIIIAAFIVGMILFNIILRNIFSDGNIEGFPKSDSIIQWILTVWIWSSICEEVLTRGLIQSFMNYQKNIKFLKLSLPVWVSGIFFGLMHFSLLRTNMDIFFISFIVFNTTVIGLLAAYYREKTNSIYPAIFIHFLANVLGSLPMILLG